MFILVRMAAGSAFLFLLSFIFRVLELPLYSECMLTSIVVFAFSMVYIIGLSVDQKIRCSRTTNELMQIRRSMENSKLETICRLVIGWGMILTMIIVSITWFIPDGVGLFNYHIINTESGFIAEYFFDIFIYKSTFHKVLAYIIIPISVLTTGLAGFISVELDYIKSKTCRIAANSICMIVCGFATMSLGMLFGYCISGLMVAMLGIIFSGILGLLKAIGFIVLIIIGIAMLSSGSDESSRGYSSDFYTRFSAQDEAHEYARRNADTRYSGQLSDNAVKYIVDHPVEFDKDTWHEANRDHRS